MELSCKQSDAHNSPPRGLSVQPLVTAVIPTRNRPDFVVKAVRSALNQSFPRIEVVVVIDGEDPPTRERLRSIGDARLHIIALAKNVGGSEARNIGIRAALGEWIALLDDDDEWLPDKIALQMDLALTASIAQPVISSRLFIQNSSLKYFWPRQTYKTGQPLSEYIYCRESIFDPANVVQTSTLLMRKSLMIETPFRKGLKMHQDIDWLLRAAQRSDVAVAMLSQALTIYRVDETSSVGRTIDWEFSTNWAREMREYFSPTAYSWFLGSECMWRAVRSRAGIRAYWQIMREFLQQGRPTIAAILALILSAIAQGFIPRRVRKLGRLLLNARIKMRSLAIKRPVALAIRQITSSGVRL